LRNGCSPDAGPEAIRSDDTFRHLRAPEKTGEPSFFWWVAVTGAGGRNQGRGRW
jgi:hypothetical protein